VLNELGNSKVKAVMNAGTDFFKVLSTVCPRSQELQNAVNILEQAVFFANRAISLLPEHQEESPAVAEPAVVSDTPLDQPAL
jgi:hypothetical protein